MCMCVCVEYEHMHACMHAICVLVNMRVCASVLHTHTCTPLITCHNSEPCLLKTIVIEFLCLGIEFCQSKAGSRNIAVSVNHVWCLMRKSDGQLPGIQDVDVNISFRESCLRMRFLAAHLFGIGRRRSTCLSTGCLPTCGSVRQKSYRR